MSEKITPFLPIYSKPPNKFLYYTEDQFDDGAGHTGIVRTACFLNKKNEQQSMVAQVVWC